MSDLLREFELLKQKQDVTEEELADIQKKMQFCEVLQAKLIQLNDGTRAVYVNYKDGDSIGNYVRTKYEIKTLNELLEAGLLYA